MEDDSGVVARVISNRSGAARSAALNLPARLLPELYSTQSNYHLFILIYSVFSFSTNNQHGFSWRTIMRMIIDICEALSPHLTESRVRTGPGKPWNFSLAFSRTFQDWKVLENEYKSWIDLGICKFK